MKPNPPPAAAGNRRRAGFSLWATLAGVAAVAAVAAWLGLRWVPSMGGGGALAGHLTAEVIRGPFEHEVWERGEIQSSSNVEVRCEVKSPGGVSILEIVPEGTEVKGGDFLVRLDDSALQRELIQQEIVCSNSQSQLQDAEAELEAARLELIEYEEGTYLQEEEQIEGELFVAKENLRRAEEYLSYSRKMNQRGYVSDVQVEADQFAVEKARKELEAAETKLRVLRDYTKKKRSNLLRAAIGTAEGRLKARRKAWELDELRLREIRDQIAKCVIVAPSGGQVVYANDPERRGSSGDLLVAEGKSVRERQVLIRLPDPEKMRVVAKVHESRIQHLQPGMEATVTLDAHPDERLRGVVSAIGEYPLPTYSIYMAHIKEYEVVVEIETNLPNLRPGMSAEVSVIVTRLPDVVQVPVHAVLERQNRYFCAIPQVGGGFETREIEVGPVNDATIVVESGLEPGEMVALRFPELETHLDLPRESDGSAPGDEAEGEVTAGRGGDGGAET